MKSISLIKYYEMRMKIWRQEKGKEEVSFLLVDLASWYVPFLQTKPRNTGLWDIMQKHIKASAEKTGRSEEKLIDHLFEAENHEIWISRFKDLGKVPSEQE